MFWLCCTICPSKLLPCSSIHKSKTILDLSKLFWSGQNFPEIFHDIEFHFCFAFSWKNVVSSSKNSYLKEKTVAQSFNLVVLVPLTSKIHIFFSFQTKHFVIAIKMAPGGMRIFKNLSQITRNVQILTNLR